jgi:hypothetical protein
MKVRLKLFWYWITFNEVGVKAMRRELFRPNFNELIRNIYRWKKI